MKNRHLIVSIAVASALAGCAMPPQNADVYAGSSSMQARQVALGQVIAVRPIRIRAGSQDGQTGAEVGGLGGAGAGAALGGMKGAIIGALAGVGLGALVGGQQTLS